MEESDIAEEPRAAGAGGGFTEELLRIYERMRESYGFSLDSNDLAEVNSQPLTSVRQSCRFYRLDELMYEGKCPQREAFAKVLSALNEPGFNFVYIIRGDGHGTHVYLGVAVRPGSPEVPQLGDFFKDVLSHSFQAEFRGSRLANLLESDISREIMEPRGEMPYMSMVIGIPSLKDDSGRREGDPDFQSIDRLASAMHGDTWQMVVVCEPMRREDITSMRQEAYRIYEALSLRAKNSAQIQHSVNESAGENKGHTEGSGTTLSSGSSQSVTKGNTESESFSDTRNSSQSVSRSEGLSETNTKSQSHSTGNSWSATNGQSVEHGVQDSCSGSGTGSSSSDLEDGIGISLSIQSSNSHTETSSVSDSYSETKSGSESWTDGTSQSVSRSTTNGTTDTTGSSNTHQTGRGTSSSTSETENHGRSDSENRSDSHSTSRSRGTSDSLSASFDVVRKKDAEELKYIDESLLPRLRSGESSGMFKTAVYLSAREPSTLNRLQSNIKSIFQSGEVGFSPLTVEPLANGSGWMDDFQIHSIDSPQQSEMAAFYGIMAKGGRIDLASCLTLEEVSLMAGMPDVLKAVPDVEDEDELTKAILVPVAEASANLEKMRAIEGARLADDLIKKGETIKGILDQIEERSPLVVKDYMEKLRARIAELLDGAAEIPEDRITDESSYKLPVSSVKKTDKKTLTIYFENYSASGEFVLQYQKNGQWYDVPVRNIGGAASSIPTEENYLILYTEDPLPSGKYRLLHNYGLLTSENDSYFSYTFEL